jgi:Derlin-2/3
MGGPFQELIHGIIIGHVYYYLVHIFPLVYGKDVLHTPQFLINYFGVGEYQYVAPAPARVQGGRPLGAMGNNTWAPPAGRRNEPAPAAAAGTGRYNWGGQGNVLGTN